MLVKVANISPTSKVAISGTIGILAGIGLGAFLATKHEDVKDILGALTSFTTGSPEKAAISAAVGGLLGANLAMPKNK